MFSKIIPLVVGLAIGSYTLYSIIKDNIDNQNNNNENNTNSNNNNNNSVNNSGNNNKDIGDNNNSSTDDNNKKNDNNDDSSNNSNQQLNSINSSGKNNRDQVESTEENGDKSKKNEEDDEDDEDNNTLPEIKNVLFGQEKFKQLMNWKPVNGIGGGLDNMGSTCYMNSILQCLSYSPIFAQYLILNEHSKNCNASGFCMFCELEVVATTCRFSAGYSNAPRNIADNIKEVAKRFTRGRQEDAHEFMGLSLDSLQQICLSQYPKGTIAERDSMTTVIGSIFGGYLRGQIKCSECQKQSTTFDPYMDLSLNVNRSQSLVSALYNFVTPETLDGDNGYKCSKCKKIVKASKELRIQIAPPILAIQFKLFSASDYGNKVNKKIHFDKLLDLSPFMAEQNDHSIYDLYAVLNHVGSTANSGHYYCFVKASNGFWYKMNDSSVSRVGLETVLESKAYMVFYSKRNPCESINTNTIEMGSDQKNSD